MTISNKIIEVQDRANEAFDNNEGILVGLEFKDTMFEEVFVKAYNDRAAKMLAWFNQAADQAEAMNNYDEGGSWE